MFKLYIIQEIQTEVRSTPKVDLAKAIEDINRGIMTAYAASKTYNVPESTVSAGRRGIKGKKVEPWVEVKQFH